MMVQCWRQEVGICGQGELRGFPFWPHFSVMWKGFQFIGCTWEVFGGEDISGGNGKDLVIGHWKVCPSERALCVLEHVDELGNAVGTGIQAQHVGWEAEKFAEVGAATVCIKMLEELLGSDVGVKGLGIVEVPIPQFVNGIADEFCSCMFGRFVGGEVINKDGVLGFTTCMDDGLSRKCQQHVSACHHNADIVAKKSANIKCCQHRDWIRGWVMCRLMHQRRTAQPYTRLMGRYSNSHNGCF